MPVSQSLHIVNANTVSLLNMLRHCWDSECRVPAVTVDVVLSYCHNSLHDTSLLKVSCPRPYGDVASMCDMIPP